jgi:hypothetical protein
VPVGDPFTHEFSTSEAPEAVLRSLVVVHTDDFARCGYRIESHSTEAVILGRRYIPEAVYQVPVLLALLFGALSAVVSQPNALGSVGGLMMVLAIALSIFVRATERVTVSLSPSGDGAHVLISGQATRRLRKRLLELAEEARSDEPVGTTPSTT